MAYIDAQLNDIRSSAASIGQEIVILNASTIAEIDAAFATLRQMRTDVLSVAVDPFFFDRASQIVVLAARHAMPALYFRREFAAVGGLMSYGSNAAEGYRVWAFMQVAFSRAKNRATCQFNCQRSSSW